MILEELLRELFEHALDRFGRGVLRFRSLRSVRRENTPTIIIQVLFDREESITTERTRATIEDIQTTVDLDRIDNPHESFGLIRAHDFSPQAERLFESMNQPQPTYHFMGIDPAEGPDVSALWCNIAPYLTIDPETLNDLRPGGITRGRVTATEVRARQSGATLRMNEVARQMRERAFNDRVEYERRCVSRLREFLAVHPEEFQRVRVEGHFRSEVSESAVLCAKAFLIENLTEEQRLDLEREDSFKVQGGSSRQTYRITKGSQMNIGLLDEAGRLVRAYCFLPEGALADYDVMLAQKIMLENDEETALAIAHRYDMPQPLPF